MEVTNREKLISSIQNYEDDYREAMKEFTESLSVDELTEWISQGYRNQLDKTKFPFPHLCPQTRGEYLWDHIFNEIIRAVDSKPNSEKTYTKLCGAIANVYENIETDYSKITQANDQENFIGLTCVAGSIFVHVRKENDSVKNYVEQSPEIKQLEEVVGKFVRNNNASEELRKYESLNAKSLFLYAELQKNNFDEEFWENIFNQDNGRYAGMAFCAMCKFDLGKALEHMPGLVVAQTRYPDMVDLFAELFTIYDKKSEWVIQKTNKCISESFRGRESTEEARQFSKEYREIMKAFAKELDKNLLFDV